MSLQVDLTHAQGSGFSLSARFDAGRSVTALFGRSGAGKTTIVNAVAGLMRPEAGRIQIDGDVLCDTGRRIWVPPHRRRVGYVFQQSRLLPHLSVQQNLDYGARCTGGVDLAARGRLVDLLGIGALLLRRPRTLSGGEAQRVAIGRALLARPRLLLLDEPLAALDQPRKEEILDYLERLRDETGIPMLYVSHALPEVARLADGLIVLEAGRVLRAGPVGEVLADPELLPIIGPRAAGSVLKGRVVAEAADGLAEIALSGGRLFVPADGSAPGRSVRVRIAAQDVLLAVQEPIGLSALNVLPGVIETLQPGAGPGMAVRLRVGEDALLARITRRSAQALGLYEGQTCFAVIKTVSVAKGDVGHVG